RCRDRGLDEPADLDDVRQGVAAGDEIRERSGEVLGDRAPHERAAAGARLDDAEQLERAQRLADRRAGDLELLGQGPLGRQLVAGVQLAAVEEGLDLAHDVLIEPAAADGLDDGQAGPPHALAAAPLDWSGGLTRRPKPYQWAETRS